MPLGSVQRPLEIVHDRQQLLHERLVRAGRERLLVARGPLAVVVELGLQPLEPVEVVVALVRQGREFVDLGRGGDLRLSLLGPLVGHDFPSSTTS